MSERVYQKVQAFLREGPPASRNLAFEAYEDAGFARAVRIYQFLASVRADLIARVASGEAVRLEVARESGRIALILHYDTARMSRTAYLGPEEWRIVQEDPAFAAVLERLGAAALSPWPAQPAVAS